MHTLPRFTLPLIVLPAALLAWNIRFDGPALPLNAQESKSPPPASAGQSPVRPDEKSAADAPAEKPASAAEQAAEEKPAPGIKPPVPSPEAEAAIEEARSRLLGYRAVQAGIVQKIAIGDRKFSATGTYIQGTDLKLRLEFEVQVGTSRGSLLEVCDGEILWTRQKISLQPVATEDLSKNDSQAEPSNGNGAEEPSTAAKTDRTRNRADEKVRITRRNVREILAAAGEAGALDENLLVAELGMGGLPGLLASLQRTMVFESRTEEAAGERNFIVVEGTWNEVLRQRWQNAQNSLLPDYIPDRVRVYLSADDRFPLRILYLKKVADRDIHRPMVTLDFKDVIVNGPVSDSDFDYEPPDGELPLDVTQQYIRQLVRSAQAQTPPANVDAGKSPSDAAGSQPGEAAASPNAASPEKSPSPDTKPPGQ